VNARHLTGSFTTQDKTYDGTKGAAVVSTSLANVANNDDVSLTGGAPPFDTKKLRTRKNVTPTRAGPTRAAPREQPPPTPAAPTTAAVRPHALNIAAATDTKTYDGGIASGGTPTVTGVQPGDTVDGLAQAFASPNALGTGGSTLVVTGYTIHDGTGGNNYTV